MDARELVARMTLEEKAGLCSGRGFWHTKPVERLGLDSIMVTDGPHGLRKQAQSGSEDHLGLGGSEPATCFPAAATTACSFDEALLREMGEALGEECLAQGVSVLLGPGINIKRSPLCGRNFEYVSEDPHLTGELASALIEGVQAKGVGTSLKHFAANNQEKWRMVTDAVVDLRALREIYLAGFERAVRRAKPWTLMCAYNRLNGVYACEHKWLLGDVLRGDWGFEGIVMTDWGAMDDRVTALRAGLELEMPGSLGYNDKRLVAAVEEGRLDVAVLNAAAVRLVELIQRGLQNRKQGAEFDKEAHHALARKVAASSAVLLKNKGGALPLKKKARVAVIGAMAKQPRYQGTGSSKINPTQVDNAFDALLEAGVDAHYAPGYSLSPGSVPSKALIREAVELAKGCDVAVVFAGLPDEYESEGYDREHLDLPDAHNRVVRAVARVAKKTVVVLQNGAPVLLPWRGDVDAILTCYLGGQAGGSACADLLCGRENPSGKLAETWPLRLEDTPAVCNFPGSEKQVQYRESIFVGYRWYDAAGRDVAYPFGYGLSYTKFEYSGLKLSRKTMGAGAKLAVQCSVKNTGRRAGAEAVQLYVAQSGKAVARAPKELKGFAKVFLKAGESKTVHFELDERSFAYYNTAEKAWCLEGGACEVLIGASSRDIRLSAPLSLKGDGAEKALSHLKEEAPAYFHLPAEGAWEIDDASFRAVYGGSPPAAQEGRPYSWNSTLRDIRTTAVGRALCPIARRVAGGIFGEDASEAEKRMAANMVFELPLRALGLMSNGMVTLDQIEGLVDLANARPVRGVKRMVAGRHKKPRAK